jgi:hypothetical protein
MKKRRLLVQLANIVETIINPPKGNAVPLRR